MIVIILSASRIWNSKIGEMNWGEGSIMLSSLAFSSKLEAAFLLELGTKMLVFILMWAVCCLEMSKVLMCTMVRLS